MNQTVFKIYGKIGHADFDFMIHKSMSQGWAMFDQLFS